MVACGLEVRGALLVVNLEYNVHGSAEIVCMYTMHNTVLRMGALNVFFPFISTHIWQIRGPIPMSNNKVF
jgi:hypothetical protein